MKYFAGLMLLLASTMIINAQSWTDATAIQGTDDISIIQAEAGNDGSTFVLGYFLGTIANGTPNEATSLGGRDYFAAKFNPDLTIGWIKHIASPGNVYVYGGIGVDATNNLYVAGGYRNYIKYSDTDSLFADGGFDTFLAKYDTDGNPIFLDSLSNGGRNERPNSLTVDANGDLIISGFFTDSIEFDAGLTLYSDDGVDDYFYGKFDPTNGDRIWAKQIRGIDNILSGRIFRITSTADAYYLTGPYADSIGFETDTIVSQNNSYDVHLIKTDLNGDLQWTRSLKGDFSENSWSVIAGDADDIYVAGWFDSPGGLTVDSTDLETVTTAGSNGSDDIFIAKYLGASGTLQWIRTVGGVDTDKVFDMEYLDSAIQVCGYFSDVVNWGSQALTTDGPADQDMFVGLVSLDGEFRGANNYSGKPAEGSTEEARAIFQNGTDLYTVITTNTTQLELVEAEFIFNPSGNYFVAVGILGCLPISIDNVFVNNVPTSGCFGDSTGSIQIVAGAVAPGFGPPYTYSVDNGETGSGSPFFPNLPAGDYTIVVSDAEGCQVVGDSYTLTEPNEIVISSVDSTDVLCFGETTGTITVNASGGTGSLNFSLDSAATFTFAVGSAANVGFGVFDSIAVQDANSCVVFYDGTATISEPTQIVLVLDSSTNVLCNGDANGFIEMSATGGVLDYSFSINGTDFQPDSVFDAVVAGTYTITVRDANDCVVAGDEVIISEPNVLEITLVNSGGTHINPAYDLGFIEFSTTGGTEPYSFAIDPDAGTLDLENNQYTFESGEEGTYAITVTDANGCETQLEPTVITGIIKYDFLNASIYPNPTTGNITIEFATEEPELTMEVFSIDGKRVMSQKVFSTGGQVQETLDLTHLDKGIYMIQVDRRTIPSGVVVK